jgi:hypothetical protein
MRKKLFSKRAIITWVVVIACMVAIRCTDKEEAKPDVVLKACGTCGNFPVCCNASSDPDGDGWGWEENASCIVNGSAAQQQQCSGGISGTCTGTTINPFTQINGGAWQNVATATVSAGGTVKFGPQPASGGSWRWTGPGGFTATTREITRSNVQTSSAGNYIATYTNTSNCQSTRTFTITVSGTPSSGEFTVSGTQLRDANGNNFIIKGINVPTAWFANDVNSNIANIRNRTGSNCLRIVVTTSTSDAVWQTSVNNCIANRMIPMVELHDVTCGTSISQIQSMANWWASKQSFLRQANIARYILINIANEWGDWNMAQNSPTTWRDGYISAVSILRNAGITSTIVIDAPNCGQDVQNGRTLRTHGPAVINSDPRRNILFGIHMYCEWKNGGGSSISTGLPSIKNAGIPVYVGEFGYQHAEGSGTCDINETQIISTCQSNGIGWQAWSWKGNGSPVQYLDLSSDWAGTGLSGWGNTVVNGSNGTKTAATASVF